MKKFINLLVCLLIITPCYGFDLVNAVNTVSGVSAVATSKYREIQENKKETQNIKQQTKEKEFVENLLTPDYRLLTHYTLLRQDKEAYDEDKSSNLSIYAELMSYYNAKPQTAINYQYATQAKQLFDEIANTDDDNVPIPEQFEKKKVFISDADFDKINEELRSIIFMINCY